MYREGAEQSRSRRRCISRVETSLTSGAKRFVNRINFIETTPVLRKLPVGRTGLEHGLQSGIVQRTILSIIDQLDETIGGAESCVGEMQGDGAEHYPKRNVASTLRTLCQ